VTGSKSLIDAALRAVLTFIHLLSKLTWFVRRPRTFGAHALALTPSGTIILVKLRYAPGWRLPGGGIGRGEEEREAVLRELREEIGMNSHGTVKLACEVAETADFRRDLASLLIVEDVRYTPPRWSLEIEEVCEATFDALPNDVSPRTGRWLEALRGKL
jgi:8-oxo-dGTP pyrophosphatase MutT (NUDIX family)